MTYNDIWRRLAMIHGESEAKAITRILLEDLFDFSLADIVCGAVEALSAADALHLEKAICRIEDYEPIQYVTGKAYFHGYTFHVEPGVLIPRPETEQLCDEVVSAMRELEHPSILDIGTGSGCISITIAKNLPRSMVSAWDISGKALHIASSNANSLSANVDFQKQDALNLPFHVGKWDAIVSNPPYICHKEINHMEKNVLNYEPHIALFVPNHDPLRFYKAIVKYSYTALKPNGQLFFEINPVYSNDIRNMLLDFGYKDITITKDVFGKERNATCRKR